jgi:hypothetical protein
MNRVKKILVSSVFVTLLITSSLYAYVPITLKIPLLKIAGGSALALLCTPIALNSARSSVLAIAVNALLLYIPILGKISPLFTTASISSLITSTIKFLSASSGIWVGTKLIKNGSKEIYRHMKNRNNAFNQEEVHHE